MLQLDFKYVTMQKIISLFIITLFFTNCKKNEFYITKIKEPSPKYPTLFYEFPLLNGSEEIANKINREIANELLDINLNDKYKSIFENVWATENRPMSRLSFLNYKVNTLNQNIYSVTFYSESCGAYCEEFDISYNFNLRNGNKITLDTILTSKGKKELIKILSHKKRKKIEDYIVHLENKKATIEDKEIINESIWLYKDCLNSLPFKTLDYIDFKIKKDSIILESGRCSNHAMRALDDLDNYSYAFHISDIETYLNKYGLNTLTNQN